MSSKPSLSLNSLLGTLSFSLTSHIHLTILISACPLQFHLIIFSYRPVLTSMHYTTVLCMQLLYSLPLISDISILVSSGTNCLYLFHPGRILASTAVSAMVVCVCVYKCYFLSFIPFCLFPFVVLSYHLLVNNEYQ